MRIAALEIENFKAIKRLSLSSLGDVVVVAGPNGCGKSCIFDAIRLLKSVYAGYQNQNDWHNFFNEFQLNINNPEEVHRIFNDHSRPVRITADFSLSDAEIAFLEANLLSTIEKEFQRQKLVGGGYSHRVSQMANPALDPDLKTRAQALAIQILNETGKDHVTASLTLHPDLATDIGPNILLEFVFGTYDPKNIGVIDYHGPNRTYQRERLGGINVSVEETANRMAQHALYNSQNKYLNIKSELASAYIRDLLIKDAGYDAGHGVSVIETLQELFRTFLPGKSFEGPRPGKLGELSFPITLADGSEHDIDDLSSGEKELVYGYLRLRNLAPSHSIILLDEPELHLNPRIVIGLPNFYRRHLGVDLNNQLWMVTHSDAFLRDAFKTGGFSIFHMSSAEVAKAGANQVTEISASSEIDRAVVELVGDVAAYRPGSTIVVFESSESASFDAGMTVRLFPEFGAKINPLSGDDKFSVKQLYNALQKAVDRLDLPIRIYAIVDRDSDLASARVASATVFNWDVYHIENYLLVPDFIKKVLDDNPTHGARMSASKIDAALKSCALQSLDSLVAHELGLFVDAQIKNCLDLGYDPGIKAAKGLSEAVERVKTRVTKLANERISQGELATKAKEIEDSLREALSSGEWRSKFRGRTILRLFAGRYFKGAPYETFRDQIIARMGDAAYQPTGMKRVIEKILNETSADNDPGHRGTRVANNKTRPRRAKK